MPTLIPAVPGMPLVIPGPGFVITIVCFPPTPGALLTVTMFVGIVFMVVNTFAVAPPEDAHKITKICYYIRFFKPTYHFNSYILQCWETKYLKFLKSKTLCNVHTQLS
jgi:hypothetical protein